MSPKADAYNVVTDRIIEALESGTVPWHKPWKTLAGVGPTSLQTGKPYRGINVWLLSLTAHAAGYSSPYWVTFKQAKERGGSVRKGEKGTQMLTRQAIRRPTGSRSSRPRSAAVRSARARRARRLSSGSRSRRPSRTRAARMSSGAT